MTDRVLRRGLLAQQAGPVQVLDALRWPTPFGAGLRIYAGAGAAIEGEGLRLTALRQVGPTQLLLGSTRDREGPLALTVGDAEAEIQASGPEPEPLAGRHVLLAQRHGESAVQVAEWLGDHAARFGFDGALILDRAPAAEGFGAALSAEALPENMTCLVVTAPLPLGQPDRPAAFATALARRAKDRSFQPDPWRAPLGHPAIYDALRWRFLARASSVFALDPAEALQAPEGGEDVFEALRISHTGVMPILGEAIFAWRIRKDAAPTRADHICRAEPMASAPNRWAASVKRLGQDMIWLPHSISGAQAIPDETFAATRAMALVFPNAEAAELVNKDLLVEDAALLAAAEEKGAKPIRPPQDRAERPKAAARPIAAQGSGRTCVVTCMKNEGPFILEWIAYHRMIGVDDFLVYTNDCDDGTVELLDLLAERGLVQRRENPFREVGAKPQQSALDAAMSEPLVQGAAWLISMDVDEFINVHVGGHRLADLYAAVAEASLISLTWRLFGNNDVVAYEDRPVTAQFSRCAPQIIRKPHQAWGFKTLFRNTGLFKGMGTHRPRGHLGQPAQWVNGSGKAMPARLFKTGWRSDITTYGYDLVTLNHYSLRSVESFLVKRDRGRVNHVARDQGEAYWFRMNNNEEQDLSIQVHAGALGKALAELLADPLIAAAHQACVAAHRAKIAALRAQPEFAALYDSFSGERLQKLSRMQRHFGMNVFLRGPGVIPDSVFDPSLPPNFLFNVEPPEGPAAE